MESKLAELQGEPIKDRVRTFHTPPITDSRFDGSQALKESYKAPDDSDSFDSNRSNDESSDANSTATLASPRKKASHEELEKRVGPIKELPVELSRQIDVFIIDLKQPKYLHPLTVIQLANLFQSFYSKFDKAAFQLLNNANNNINGNNSINNTPTHSGSLLSVSRETLSSGLSGIFARSRSGSINNNIRRQRRSSSLFGNDTNSNIVNNSVNGPSTMVTNNNNINSSMMATNMTMSLSNSSTQNSLPLLSPDEITTHLENNEIVGIKIDKYMELCERDIFQRILEVGTSVSSVPTMLNGKDDDFTNSRDNSNTSMRDFNESAIINNNTSNTNNSNSVTTGNYFDVTNLFRNSVDFLEYDQLMDRRIKCLNEIMDSDDKLRKFLDLPVDSIKFNKEIDSEIKDVLINFTQYSIPPFEKSKILLKLHEILKLTDSMSNDEFLSLLIYYLIKTKPKHIFLNIEFIKLFRYKKKLVENELYSLTNFIAALVYIESLTINDLSIEYQENLSDRQRKILKQTISSKIHLPNSIMNWNNSSTESPTMDIPKIIEHPVSNTSSSSTTANATNTTSTNNNNGNSSNRGTFELSLRGILGKMKSYTPPNTLSRSSSQMSLDIVNDTVPEENDDDIASDEAELEENGQNKSMEILPGARLVHSINDDEQIEGDETMTNSTTLNMSAIDDDRRFLNKDFDELNMKDLKEIFNIYKKIFHHPDQLITPNNIDGNNSITSNSSNSNNSSSNNSNESS
ncbi:hypothetical protein TBLA_0H03570 [Henningerozyma blattae CBS 6284]|uniref:VPS9 domain-containing protein n=1 Tax=Henningerozyma blattae (strain ATCC 34711 / CBS 6284 / DSM 70876 / NBRC 10599 / NRRL Y-10934 / UCD 77-7) TaxID=1071380 RepID=I2H8D7_HENB6|nr:hypothetical protein TBLA_0H03570 [Tetrapisispora blattae CBS 6284]CCH62639.1 hypothetical protein TBLA_0H03570 [Tetrapisispora blattae CBS 6284]